MKKFLLLCLLVLMCPAVVFAEDTKIDPDNYICAELVAEQPLVGGQPPLFQALQIDGYVSSDVKMDVASPDTMTVMLAQVFLWCQKNPEAKVVDMWKKMRETGPVPSGHWNAKTSTCREYALNPDDASGFILWLDGYNRKQNNTKKTILGSDKDIQEFIDACMLTPDRKMIDVLNEKAK